MWNHNIVDSKSQLLVLLYFQFGIPRYTFTRLCCFDLDVFSFYQSYHSADTFLVSGIETNKEYLANKSYYLCGIERLETKRMPESIELFIEDQAVSPSYDLAPPTPLSPLSR